ncbi:MAG: 4Fe-4S cluster-binding domain-containing protein [Acutalibacteraceae bacterium]|jgi:putative pyruvate formate lyase activating enzyme
MIQSCHLCPRHCAVQRTADAGSGVCKMGSAAVVARAALHFWEEPCISGERGSGAIFFSGCNLHCAFCQNDSISRQNFGRRISSFELSDIFRSLVEQGAENINLVTATHFIPAVLEALKQYRPPVPIVYNCGGYESTETLRSLEGFVDIYLPDFKYALTEPAKRYSAAPDYPETAKAALLEMHRQQPACFYDERGMLQKGMIVRHLILPGNTRNSIAALEWLAKALPGVPVSLMAQYLPCGSAAEFPEINRRITRREYEKVLDRLFTLGLDGFVQERSSAKKNYIPSFGLEGVPAPKGKTP